MHKEKVVRKAVAGAAKVRCWRQSFVMRMLGGACGSNTCIISVCITISNDFHYQPEHTISKLHT